ncbi:hypothetical protein BDW62DRAFT_216238 [Aspergillus aurantiobrunneus]
MRIPLFPTTLSLLTICAALYSERGFSNPQAINGMILWTDSDCRGIPASTIFNSTTFGQNISNTCVSRSFSLFRPLRGEEQLDISVIQEPGATYLNTLLNKSACTDFIQSYFPINGSENCYNTPPFTCHRLWSNSGLAEELRMTEIFKNWTLPSLLPVFVPSSCSQTNSRPSLEPSSTPFPTASPELSSSPSGPTVSKSKISPSLERVHTVQVNGSSPALFNPAYLDNVPSGHVIKFQSDTPFDLINSTLDKPCRRTHEFLTCNELYYNVTETEPVWFFVCPPRGALCYCNRDTHFALNPGGLLQPFRESVKHSNWVITRPAINRTTSTTSAGMATVTLTITVWP